MLPLRDPRLLAKQLTTIDQMAGPGRLTVAFGIGAVQNDFDVQGLPFNRRGRIAGDYLAALQAILYGEQPVTFESKTLSFSGGEFFRRPERIQFSITRASEPAHRRAVRYGEGWMTVYVSPAEYAAAKGDCGTRRRGQSESRRVQLGHGVVVCLAPSRDEAMESALRRWCISSSRWSEGLEVSIVGDVNDVSDKIDRYREAGVEILRAEVHLS